MPLPHSSDPSGGLGAELIPRLTTRSSARFGALSHHSFFSRHNPHPSRVRHISGLNGRPVCTVRDDWFVTSSLFPHPLLKGGVVQRGGALFLPPRANSRPSGFLSERWREELKELASKISTQQQQIDKQEPVEEEPIRQTTQYSSKTGRLIPSTSSSSSSSSSSCLQRRSTSRSWLPAPPGLQLLHHQELMVLELLCQILQTDSLSTVQHWLLLAGPREKELVMGMIKQAVGGSDLQNQDFRVYPHLQQQFSQTSGSAWSRANSFRVKPASTSPAEEKPERIGEAEVFQVHSPDDSADTKP